MAWVGSNISKGMYKTASMNVWVLGIVYFGVVTSDMITFGVGVLLKWGFFRQLRQSLLRFATITTIGLLLELGQHSMCCIWQLGFSCLQIKERSYSNEISIQG